MAAQSHFIAWFREINKHDVSLVGGKGANLGEIYNAGIPVPNGFVVTANAYYHFIRENALSTKIQHLISTTNFNNPKSLDQVSKHIKKLILDGKISEELTHELVASYAKLGTLLNEALVAVRSSATAEDLANASFAGQQETFLNVKGDAVLLEKIKEGWASLFDARAIFYRHQQKFDHIKTGIALVVQKMVESEKSGVMFTIDPVTNNKETLVIEAIYGLGELIVQGEVNPDHYEVKKTDLTILKKEPNYQAYSMIKKGVDNKKIKLDKSKGSKLKLSDKEIKELATLGKKLEKHYYFPQDIEWAIEKNKVYIVQTRAVTTTNTEAHKTTVDTQTLQLLLKGDPASPGIGNGPVKIIRSAKEIDKILPGDVLVAPQTNPDYVSAMKKASAIVTDSGGRTSHAAIVSRELGIPAVVGTEHATTKLTNNEVVSVDGSKGEVYKGGVVKNISPTVLKYEQIKTATKIYVNLAEPEAADRVGKLNVDGIGLLRAEFIMANIGVHPKKMINEGKRQEYINKLAENLAKFCTAFNGKPVVYRASDFKTNEYRNLVGGKDYEPLESNPMLGYRGAFRYMHDPEVFKLELEAIKKVRNEMGLKNLWIMVPFVRTVEELEKVKKLITNAGLIRSETFKIWMMVEIPTNVIMLDQFIKVGIDGVSIGSNDLTMLMMGTDRDNHEVASEFNEMYPSMMWAFQHVVKTAHKYGITSSLCGQAASTYTELIKQMVFWGVTSLSVSPDAVDNTRRHVLQFEKELLRK